MLQDLFKEKLNKLNVSQKLAVSEIDGPVMVVAGPGTGKTEILTLRIGNILQKTDTTPDSILCLTFTNSGVREMKERLHRYIGQSADSVRIATFHSFTYDLIEKYYEFLDFGELPKLLSDDEAVFIVDEILHENDWEYISPRGNPSMYFGDLKQLISILKHERIYASLFNSYIEDEIKFLEDDPSSISSRGESKGKIKKEVEKKIEALLRTKEVVKFYEIYESKKKELSYIDYDDVLELAVYLVENFDDVKNDMRENFQYVLVDEHQDSSGVQNAFLKAVWSDVEKPNIFVVGDDRQLIYAFSGAKLSYFEEFSDIFSGAKKIVLTENYRSTGPVLSLADDLLKSSISNEKLNSNKKGDHKIMLYEYSYPRDEVIGAANFFKHKIEEGMDPNECALLVPKNYNVRQAIEILSEMGVPVSSGKNLSLFQVRDGDYLRRVLGIIADPNDSVLIATSLFDKTSNVLPSVAHKFFRDKNRENVSLDDLVGYGDKDNMFAGENPISKWGKKLVDFIDELSNLPPTKVISRIGNDLLIGTSSSNEELLNRVEVVRSFIHLATLYEERNKKLDLKSFLEYIDRLESYKTHIELAKFGNDNGVKVMTLHKSKGLEYECVWVAHMNEETLMSTHHGGFTLPEKIKDHINKRSVDEARRELYVAITRAKEFCVLSYANENYNGNDMNLASIIRDLPDMHFIKKNKDETENELLKEGVDIYVRTNVEQVSDGIKDVEDLVKNNYQNIKVSVSMLNNFFECPWRWYFRNFLKLPEAKLAHLSIGTVVHSMIEFVLKSEKTPGEDILNIKILEKFKTEGILDKNDLRKFSKDALDILKDWIGNYYDKLSPNFKSERSISYVDKKNFPNLLMYGKIDLSEYISPNEIMVTDFKTGSVKTSGLIEKIDEEGRMSPLLRQLAMYSYLINGENNNTRVTSSRLLFLEGGKDNKNSLYETTINAEQIDLLKRDIREYDESLKSGDWVGRECHFKPFTGGAECEYCKLKKQIYG